MKPTQLKAAATAMAQSNELDAMDADIFSLSVESFAGLLAAYWKEIRDAAADENNGGKIKVNFPLVLDFSQRTPAGTVTVSFVPHRVNDNIGFRAEDPDQGKLEFEKPQVVSGE